MDCWVLKPCNCVLPYQLDLRTGQLWVVGQSTLQLQQQRLAPDVKAFLKTSVVLPPDSEIIVPVSVRSPSGIRPGSCALVEPSRESTEYYGIVVGRTLVDASSWSAGLLMVNPNAEEIVLPGFTFVGSGVGGFGGTGSHPSLGESGRSLLRDLLHRYRYVFPAPGEPVTDSQTEAYYISSA